MKKAAKIIFVIMAGLFIASAAPAMQSTDTTAIVVCGKSEQPTPCMLVLNRSVPSYELTVKNKDVNLVTFKAERVEGAWQILGQRRRERLIEVVVDTKDASCVIFNLRVPNIDKDLIPEGCDGLLIKAVESH